MEQMSEDLEADGPIARRALVRLLDEMVAARPDRTAGLLLLHINEFSQVNVEFGYGSAETIFASLVDRLRDALRPHDRVLPLGHGQFAALLPGLKNAGHGLLAAKKIQRSLRDFQVHDVALPLSTRMAVATYPETSRNTEGVLRQADIALDRCSPDSNEIRVAENTGESVPQELAMRRALKTALQENELELHFQPKIDLARMQVTGVEALSRWVSADFGVVPPDRFVAMAESTGLIKSLTTWSLNLALNHQRRWAEEGMPLGVAVNLSPLLLNDPEIVELVARSLEVWRADPSWLTLEVTEGSMMSDPVDSLRILNALSGLGVRLSIDDFGTGYSSLAYLSQLPVHELKIDKSFVMGLAANPGNLKIVQAVIDLAHNFRLSVVAEGVEDAETAAMLAARGCDHCQGYHFSRPLAGVDFLDWMNAIRTDAEPAAVDIALDAALDPIPDTTADPTRDRAVDAT